MSEVFKAIILGIVQGLTEFLPVSSTGHLIIAQHAMGLSDDDFGLRFDAAIHLGTLVAVLIYFRELIARYVIAWLQSVKARSWSLNPASRVAWLLILGTIPGGIAGFLLQDFVENQVRSTALVVVMLIVFTLPMWLADRYGRNRRSLDSLTTQDAVLIGTAQAVALVPGVSRSGITISTGMLAGLRREEAAAFAFLLSGPIIAAAGLKQLFDIARGDVPPSSLHNEFAVYLAGLVTAAIVGYAAIWFLVRYLRTNPLTLFIVYRIIAGIVLLALVAVGAL